MGNVPAAEIPRDEVLHHLVVQGWEREEELNDPATGAEAPQPAGAVPQQPIANVGPLSYHHNRGIKSAKNAPRYPGKRLRP